MLFKLSVVPDKTTATVRELGGDVEIPLDKLLSLIQETVGDLLVNGQLRVGNSTDQLPYKLIVKAEDGTYHFKFEDLNGDTIISSTLNNLFISKNSIIRGLYGLGISLGSEPGDGDGISVITIGPGIFTGHNNFIAVSPTIKSNDTDSQIGLRLTHSIEQGSLATGEVRTFYVNVNQILNPTLTYTATQGNSFVTCIDPRGTAEFNPGDIVTGVGIPAATSVISVIGSQINLSNTVTTSVVSELLTNTSVTYNASNIVDYSAYSADLGNSPTQKGIYITENGNLVFAIGGDGSFSFKGGVYSQPEQWVITNPPVTPVRNIDVNTATLDDLRKIVATLIQDDINKGFRKTT